MSKKYEKFDIKYMKVPVQYGHLSKRERRCRRIGYIGSLIREPFWIETYYRIDDSEIGAGRFFYKRRWHGDKNGTIEPKGTTWEYLTYTTYKRLPDEIKKEIKKEKD